MNPKIMSYQPRQAVFTAVGTCLFVFCSATSSKAADPYSYTFNLDTSPLLNGCLLSSINPDCYADQNVIRASGFSHFDGSGAPALQGTMAAPFKTLLDDKPLWKRLYDTSFSMHVIDKNKPKTLLETVNGTEIYTDEDFNSWRKFGDKWYVKMSHQFNKDPLKEGPLWCQSIPSCQGSGGGSEVINVGVGGATVFFTPFLSVNAPQEKKDKVNLGDWLRARPTQYDLANPETVNARANFFVGGRGISPSDNPGQAFWDQVALVWADPDQLYRPAQNPDISNASFAANVTDHFNDIQGSPNIDWCINQFTNVVDTTKNGQCFMAEDKSSGNLFDNFRDYYISYFNAGSNSGDTLPSATVPYGNYYPFPFTGLGVTYDPYYQALLEASLTESQLSAVVSSLIGTSEFIYAIPKDGQSNSARMYLDAVYSINSTVAVPVPGPLPILGVGASFAFARRLRRRIRLGPLPRVRGQRIVGN